MKITQITTIQLPVALSENDITTAFAGCPEALHLLTPYLRAFLAEAPQHLELIVDMLTRQAQQRAQRVRLQHEIVEQIRQLLPTAFLDSLPRTLQGFTQQQPEYWLEPEREAVRSDSPKFIVSGHFPDVDHWVGNSMAPRFLNGVTYVVEEVLPGEELIPGSAYRMEITDSPMLHGGGTTFRLLEVKQGPMGPYMVIEHDADPCPAGEQDQWGLRLGEPGWHLYRFLHYQAFRGLALPTQAFPVRPWEKILARQQQWQAQRELRNAKQREAYARRKAGRAVLPMEQPSRALALAA